MSVTDQSGWDEVERRAQEHEAQLNRWKRDQNSIDMLNLIQITAADRLRGSICEALSQLEQGYPTAAHQVLQDALKIGGVK